MATILVSGGSGYVGRFIVESFLARGYDVVVAGRTPPADGFFSAPVRFVPLSLEPDEIDPAIFEGVDHFVHAAFDHVEGKYRGGEGTDPEGFVRRNLHGSVALFEAAKLAGVRRVVFLSSRAVYGLKPAGETLFETTEPEPETLYGVVKLGAEKALLALAGERFEPLVLRVTGVYGPAGPGKSHKWADIFYFYALGRALRGHVGTEVHGDDVGRAVCTVLETDSSALSHSVFNVSDIVVDRADLLRIVGDHLDIPYGLCPRCDASGLNVMDTARLRALGWQPGGMDLLRSTVKAMADDLPPA